MSCSNNFKQIGLAMHDYHDAFKTLPAHGAGTEGPKTEDGNVSNWWTSYANRNWWRMSALVGMTPFMEQQPLWEIVSNPNDFDKNGTVDFQAFGPTPQNINFSPWATEISALRCPSDPGKGLPALGRTNYALCLGDSMWWGMQGAHRPEITLTNGHAEESRAANRGVFVVRQYTGLRDILDGTANTVAMTEIATDLGDRDSRTIGKTHPMGAGAQAAMRDNPSLCKSDTTMVDPLRPRFWTAGSIEGATKARGYRWADCQPVMTCVYTILPPNSPLCVPHDSNGQSIMTASSRHPGGVHVLMGDGAIRFVTDSIESGNQNRAMVHLGGTAALGNAPGTESPYGLWGALGTRGMKEILKGEF
jgi:prepilin-type processing-associated H-X9-DG protein